MGEDYDGYNPMRKKLAQLTLYSKEFRQKLNDLEQNLTERFVDNMQLKKLENQMIKIKEFESLKRDMQG